jgi:hypothetical protein
MEALKYYFTRYIGTVEWAVIYSLNYSSLRPHKQTSELKRVVLKQVFFTLSS